MTITNLLDATVKHLDARYELASTPVGIYIPEVQQFVLLMRPEYMADPAAEALDIAILVNKFFSTRRAELTTYGISPTLSVEAGVERCKAFVQLALLHCPRCVPRMVAGNLLPSGALVMYIVNIDNIVLAEYPGWSLPSGAFINDSSCTLSSLSTQDGQCPQVLSSCTLSSLSTQDGHCPQ
eukprot:3018565-Amphidinium_carterae.1